MTYANKSAREIANEKAAAAKKAAPKKETPTSKE